MSRAAAPKSPQQAKPFPRFFLWPENRNIIVVEFLSASQKIIHRRIGARGKCSGSIGGAERLEREGTYEEITPEQARDRISKAQRRSEEE